MTRILKKLAIIAIAATINVTVYAQTMYGVQAGVNFSTLSGWLREVLESTTLDINKKSGIQFGVFSEVPMRNPSFGLQGELLFSQLGTKMEDNYTQYGRRIREIGTLNLNCFMSRVHVQFNHVFTYDLALTLHTGFHGGYALWAKAKYERFVNDKKEDGDSEKFFGDASGKAADFGVGFGAALTIQEKFRVGLSYDAGIVFHNTSITLTYMLGK